MELFFQPTAFYAIVVVSFSVFRSRTINLLGLGLNLGDKTNGGLIRPANGQTKPPQATKPMAAVKTRPLFLFVFFNLAGRQACLLGQFVASVMRANLL